MELGSIPLNLEAVVGTPCDFTVLHGRSSKRSICLLLSCPGSTERWGRCCRCVPAWDNVLSWSVSLAGDRAAPGLRAQRGGASARLLLCLCLCVDPLGFCKGFFWDFFFFQSSSTPRGSNWAGGISTVLCVPQGLLLSDLILPPTPFILFC